MSIIDSNKIVARRYLEQFWNGDDPAMIAEIAVADVIGHPTPGETLQGRDILVQRHAGLRRIYGDPHFAVEDLIGEGDNVATVRRFYDEYAAGNADIILEVHLDTIKMHYAGEVEDVPTQVLRDDLSTNLLIYQSTNHHQE